MTEAEKQALIEKYQGKVEWLWIAPRQDPRVLQDGEVKVEIGGSLFLSSMTRGTLSLFSKHEFLIDNTKPQKVNQEPCEPECILPRGHNQVCLLAPEPTCKWHQKVVQTYDSSFAIQRNGQTLFGNGEYTAVQKYMEDQRSNAEAAALKSIKHSLREWPTCPEGEVSVRWWEQSGTNNYEFHEARWECSCGRAGGVK